MFFGDGKSHAILIREFRKARDLDSLLNGMDERFFHSPCVDHGTSKPRGSSTSASFEYPPEKFTTWPLNTHHFEDFSQLLPSGKHTKNYGTSPFLMGKSTISMAIFNSKLFNYQRVFTIIWTIVHRFSPLFHISFTMVSPCFDHVFIIFQHVFTFVPYGSIYWRRYPLVI